LAASRLSAPLPEDCRRIPVEIGARIVVKARGIGLGTMAKASVPSRGAGHSSGERKKSVLCVTQRLNRALRDLRGTGAARRVRPASNASVTPSPSRSGGASHVHGLFHWLCVAAAYIIVVNHGSFVEMVPSVHVEIGARIVVKARGIGLGTMAKASVPSRGAGHSYDPPVW